MSQRAQTVAADLHHDGFRPNPVIPAAPAEQTVVQVVDPAGQAVAAPADVAGEPRLSGLRPPAGAAIRAHHTLPVADEGAFHIVALGVGSSHGTYTVLVGQAPGPVDASVRKAAALLLVGSPLLLVVVGAATFWFVGRSLPPVEGIRGEVTASRPATCTDPNEPAEPNGPDIDNVQQGDQTGPDTAPGGAAR